MYQACPWVTDYYDLCLDNFQEFYAENEECLAIQQYAIPKVSFTSFWFLWCYFWITGVTVAVFVWCALNPSDSQADSLISASVRDEERSSEKGSKFVEEWTQAGYKEHWLGLIIHILVWITLIGIQALLLILTLFYYTQQESIDRWKIVFYDDIQVLKAFM
jgi:hypothetical protein